jgi:predicted ferric reductase
VHIVGLLAVVCITVHIVGLLAAVCITVHIVGLLAAVYWEIKHRNAKNNKHGGRVNSCHNLAKWCRLPNAICEWQVKTQCYVQ